MLGMTCYLDDSGSDDGSPLVTCGGPLMSRLQFKNFSQRWAKMYDEVQFPGYTLLQPLHMPDFIRGKYVGLYPEFKRALFIRVAKLVSEHKFYSLSVAVSHQDFNNELSEDVRKNLIGPYAFAFFMLVLANQGTSELLKKKPIRTAYLVDRGFGRQEQLNQAHDLIVRFEKAFGGFRHTGALATDSDDRVPALQAADAISWASRQLELHRRLPEGFKPLEKALREDVNPPHVTSEFPRPALKCLLALLTNGFSNTERFQNYRTLLADNSTEFWLS